MGPWFFGVDAGGEGAAAAVAVLFVIIDHVFECDVLAASNDRTPEPEICNLRVASDCPGFRRDRVICYPPDHPALTFGCVMYHFLGLSWVFSGLVLRVC